MEEIIKTKSIILKELKNKNLFLYLGKGQRWILFIFCLGENINHELVFDFNLSKSYNPSTEQIKQIFKILSKFDNRKIKIVNRKEDTYLKKKENVHQITKRSLVKC